MSTERLVRGLYHTFFPGRGNGYHPYLLGGASLVVIFFALLILEGGEVASAVLPPDTANNTAAVLPAAVISLTNAERHNDALGNLRENPLLDAAAEAKARDMAVRGYFAHQGPDGKEPWDWIAEFGYPYAEAGENLAVRFDDSSAVVNAWMASPAHRANILKPEYRDIGVGVAQGTFEGEPATFTVEFFGATSAATSSAAQGPERILAFPGGGLIAAVNAQAEGSFWNDLEHRVLQSFSSPDPIQWFFSILSGLLILLIAVSTYAQARARLSPHPLMLSAVVLAALALGFAAFNTQTLTTLSSGDPLSRSAAAAFSEVQGMTATSTRR